MQKKRYDYLIVGAGLFGSVFAHEMKKRGASCCVIDRRAHVGGNVYTKEQNGIRVHCYGAHIFHTNDKNVWEYVNRFAEFNQYINAPVAIYRGEVYNLPFNMNTFSRMWGIRTPQEAQEIIAEQIRTLQIDQPQNLEEQALSMVGTDVYEKLVKGYTEKQWGRDCRELPAFLIRRLPLRFTYDNNYFNARWQGIPIGGYTPIIEQLLEGIPVKLNQDFCSLREQGVISWDRLLYTGPIDEYFDSCLGHLEYRSLRFETETLPVPNYQGNAVVNYTEREIPYTRIIEHKHFEFGDQPETVITREYPAEWKPGMEPFYPVNDEKNSGLYERYRRMAEKVPDVIFGGRLGDYRYYDMDQVIAQALTLADMES